MIDIKFYGFAVHDEVMETNAKPEDGCTDPGESGYEGLATWSQKTKISLL